MSQFILSLIIDNQTRVVPLPSLNIECFELVIYIAQYFGVSQEEQVWLYDGKYLDFSGTLASKQLHNQSCIYILRRSQLQQVAPQNQSIIVYCVVANSSEPLSCYTGNTVQEVKQFFVRLAQSRNLFYQNPKLWYNSQFLDDSATLFDSHISHQSQLYLVEQEPAKTLTSIPPLKESISNQSGAKSGSPSPPPLLLDGINLQAPLIPQSNANNEQHSSSPVYKPINIFDPKESSATTAASSTGSPTMTPSLLNIIIPDKNSLPASIFENAFNQGEASINSQDKSIQGNNQGIFGITSNSQEEKQGEEKGNQTKHHKHHKHGHDHGHDDNNNEPKQEVDISDDNINTDHINDNTDNNTDNNSEKETEKETETEDTPEPVPEIVHIYYQDGKKNECPYLECNSYETFINIIKKDRSINDDNTHLFIIYNSKELTEDTTVFDSYTDSMHFHVFTIPKLSIDKMEEHHCDITSRDQVEHDMNDPINWLYMMEQTYDFIDDSKDIFTLPFINSFLCQTNKMTQQLIMKETDSIRIVYKLKQTNDGYDFYCESVTIPLLSQLHMNFDEVDDEKKEYLVIPFTHNYTSINVILQENDGDIEEQEYDILLKQYIETLPKENTIKILIDGKNVSSLLHSFSSDFVVDNNETGVLIAKIQKGYGYGDTIDVVAINRLTIHNETSGLAPETLNSAIYQGLDSFVQNDEFYFEYVNQQGNSLFYLPDLETDNNGHNIMGEQIHFYYIEDVFNKEIQFNNHERFTCTFKNFIAHSKDSQVVVTIDNVDYSMKPYKSVIAVNNHITPTLTTKARARIDYVENAIKSGIHLLIEGTTSSAKTYTVEYICHKCQLPLLRFNFSPSTTLEDLIGDYVIKTINGKQKLVFSEGPFTQAFINGYILLLDEMSLAREEIIEPLMGCLDSEELYISKTSGYQIYKMHKDFRIIATQNPAGSTYERTKFSNRVLDHFRFGGQNKFPPMDDTELNNISKSIIKDEDAQEYTMAAHKQCRERNEKRKLKLQQNIDDNLKLSENQSSQNDSHIILNEKYIPESTVIKEYTIRDHTRVKMLLREKASLSHAIHLVFETPLDENERIPTIPITYMKEPLIQRIWDKFVYDMDVSMKAGNHILVVSPSVYTSSTYTDAYSYYKTNENSKNHFNTIYGCSSISNEVLIGSYVFNKENKRKPIWKDSSLLKSIINGETCIFESLHLLKSNVIERLNSLLELVPNDGNNHIIRFDERTIQPVITIHPNFRIIATVEENAMKRFSPALLNRFLIVYVYPSKFDLKNLNYSPQLNKKYSLFDKDIYVENMNLKKVLKKEYDNYNYFEKLNIQKIIDFLIPFTPEDLIPSYIDYYLKKNFASSLDIFKNILVHNMEINKFFISLCINRTLCLEGPINSGKSYLLQEIIHRRKINNISILHLSNDSESGQLMGFYSIDGEFHDGILLQCIKEGRILIIDKAQNITKDLFEEFLQFMDPLVHTFRYSHKDIHIHPNFRIIFVFTTSHDRLPFIIPSYASRHIIPQYTIDEIKQIINEPIINNLLDEETTHLSLNYLIKYYSSLCENNHDEYSEYSGFVDNQVTYKLAKNNNNNNNNNEHKVFEYILTKAFLSINVQLYKPIDNNSSWFLEALFKICLLHNYYAYILVGNGEEKDKLFPYIYPDYEHIEMSHSLETYHLIGQTILIDIKSLNNMLQEYRIVDEQKYNIFSNWYAKLIPLAMNNSVSSLLFQPGVITSNIIKNKLVILDNIDLLSKDTYQRLLPLLNHSRYEGFFEDSNGLFANELSNYPFDYENNINISQHSFPIVGTIENNVYNMIANNTEFFTIFCADISDADIRQSYSILSKLDECLKITQRYISLSAGLQKENISFSFLKLLEKIENAFTSFPNALYFVNYCISDSYGRRSLSRLSFKDQVSKSLIDLLTPNDDSHVDKNQLLEIFNKDIIDKVWALFNEDANQNKFYPVKTIILMAISLVIGWVHKIPIILEGAPGIGKSACAIALYELYNIKPERFNFAPNMSIQDLFGGYKIENKNLVFQPGKLTTFLQNNPNEEHVLILDEINLAPVDVLEVMTSLIKTSYKKEKTDFFIPGFGKILLPPMTIICTLNPAIMSSQRNTLPSSMVKSCLFFKDISYSIYELLKISQSIIEGIANDPLLENDPIQKQNRNTIVNPEFAERLSTLFITSLELSTQYRIPFSLRDTIKVSELSKRGHLDIYASLWIVFGCKFFGDGYEKINKALKINNVNDINIKIENSSITFKGPWTVHLPTSKPEKNDYMVTIEKILCYKLALSYESKRTIILYGPSPSGKSYTIQRYAELMKKKLIRIPLHSESSSSTLLGELELLEDNGKPILRFRNGPLPDAMENGYWILIEDIHLASGELLERFNSLCEEKPTFKLLESDVECTYVGTANEEDYILDPITHKKVLRSDCGKKLIHPEFRLFFTLSTNNITVIPPPLLSRCIIIATDLLSNQKTVQELAYINQKKQDPNISSKIDPKYFGVEEGKNFRQALRIIKTDNENDFKEEYGHKPSNNAIVFDPKKVGIVDDDYTLFIIEISKMNPDIKRVKDKILKVLGISIDSFDIKLDVPKIESCIHKLRSSLIIYPLYLIEQTITNYENENKPIDNPDSTFYINWKRWKQLNEYELFLKEKKNLFKSNNNYGNNNYGNNKYGNNNYSNNNYGNNNYGNNNYGNNNYGNNNYGNNNYDNYSQHEEDQQDNSHLLHPLLHSQIPVLSDYFDVGEDEIAHIFLFHYLANKESDLYCNSNIQPYKQIFKVIWDDLNNLDDSKTINIQELISYIKNCHIICEQYSIGKKIDRQNEQNIQTLNALRKRLGECQQSMDKAYDKIIKQKKYPSELKTYMDEIRNKVKALDDIIYAARAKNDKARQRAYAIERWVNTLSAFDPAIAKELDAIKDIVNINEFSMAFNQVCNFDKNISYNSIDNKHSRLYCKCSHFIVFCEELLSKNMNISSAFFQFYSMFEELNLQSIEIFKNAKELPNHYDALKIYINCFMGFLAQSFILDIKTLSIIKSYDFYIHSINEDDDEEEEKKEVNAALIELGKLNWLLKDSNNRIQKEKPQFNVAYELQFGNISDRRTSLTFKPVIYELKNKIDNNEFLNSKEMEQCCGFLKIYGNTQKPEPGEIYHQCWLQYEYDLQVNSYIKDVDLFIIRTSLSMSERIKLICPYKREDTYELIYSLFEDMFRNNERKQYIMQYQNQIKDINTIISKLDSIEQNAYDNEKRDLEHQLTDSKALQKQYSSERTALQNELKYRHEMIMNKINEYVKNNGNKNDDYQNKYRNMEKIEWVKTMLYFNALNEFVKDKSIYQSNLRYNDVEEVYRQLSQYKIFVASKPKSMYFKLAYIKNVNNYSKLKVQFRFCNYQGHSVFLNKDTIELDRNKQQTDRSCYYHFINKTGSDYFVIVLPWSPLDLEIIPSNDIEIYDYFYPYYAQYSLKDLQTNYVNYQGFNGTVAFVLLQLMCNVTKKLSIETIFYPDPSELYKFITNNSSRYDENDIKLKNSINNNSLLFGICSKGWVKNSATVSLLVPDNQSDCYVMKLPINQNEVDISNKDLTLTPESINKKKIIPGDNYRQDNTSNAYNQYGLYPLVWCEPNIDDLKDYNDVKQKLINTIYQLDNQTRNISSLEYRIKDLKEPQLISDSIFLPNESKLIKRSNNTSYELKDCIVILGESPKDIILPKDNIFYLPEYMKSHQEPTIIIPIINPYKLDINFTSKSDPNCVISNKSNQLLISFTDSFDTITEREAFIQMKTSKSTLELHLQFAISSNSDIIKTNRPCEGYNRSITCPNSYTSLEITYQNQTYRFNKSYSNRGQPFLQDYSIYFSYARNAKYTYFLIDNGRITPYNLANYQPNTLVVPPSFGDKIKTFKDDILSKDGQKYLNALSYLPILLCTKNQYQELCQRIYIYLQTNKERYIPFIREKITTLSSLLGDSDPLSWNNKEFGNEDVIQKEIPVTDEEKEYLEEQKKYKPESTIKIVTSSGTGRKTGKKGGYAQIKGDISKDIKKKGNIAMFVPDMSVLDENINPAELPDEKNLTDAEKAALEEKKKKEAQNAQDQLKTVESKTVIKMFENMSLDDYLVNWIFKRKDDDKFMEPKHGKETKLLDPRTSIIKDVLHDEYPVIYTILRHTLSVLYNSILSNKLRRNKFIQNMFIILDLNVSHKPNKSRMRTITSILLLLVCEELGIQTTLLCTGSRGQGFIITEQNEPIQSKISKLFDLEGVKKVPSTPLDIFEYEDITIDDKSSYILISDCFSEQLISSQESVKRLLKKLLPHFFLFQIIGNNEESLIDENQDLLNEYIDKNFGKLVFRIKSIEALEAILDIEELIKLFYYKEERDQKKCDINNITYSIASNEDSIPLLDPSNQDTDYTICKSLHEQKISLLLPDIQDSFLNYEPNGENDRLFTFLNGKIPNDIFFNAFNSTILQPNKPTSWVPSTTGTTLHNSNYFRFVLTGTGDGKIFKVKTGNKVRSYCVSIIIDCTQRSFCDFNKAHSYNTLLLVLRGLSEMSIPHIDIWIAKDTIIQVATGISSNDIWTQSILSNILGIISKPSQDTCLSSTIKVAYATMKARSESAICMIFTNGTLLPKEKESILPYVSEPDITCIGIGLGYKLYDYQDLYPTFMWSSNPKALRDALLNMNNASLSIVCGASIPPVIEMKEKIQNLPIIVNNKKLIETINNAHGTYEQLAGRYNIYAASDNQIEHYEGQEANNDFDLVRDGQFKGYNILFVILYLCRNERNKKTNEIIDEKITERSLREGDYSGDRMSPIIKLEQKGFECHIVYDYATAARELLSGKYRVSIITCSPGDKKLPTEPDDADKNPDPDYLSEFLNAVHIFNLSGGGVMWMLENYPYTYEADIYYKYFENINELSDPKGEVAGGQEMIRDKSGMKNQATNPGTFITVGGDIIKNQGDTSIRLDTGIFKIFEGKTLAALDEKELIRNRYFVFARDNEGYPAIMIRESKGNEGHMIIDSAASKLFLEFTTIGTSRWIANSMAWLENVEKYYFQGISGIEDIPTTLDIIPVNERKTINIPYDERKLKGNQTFVLSIMMDCTGSMSGEITGTKQSIVNAIRQVEKYMMDNNMNNKIYIQFVGYREIPEISSGSSAVRFPSGLTTDPRHIESYLGTVGAGGGSCCCDLEGGLKDSIKNTKSLPPDEYAFAFIIIGDQPAHSHQSCSYSSCHPYTHESWDTVWNRHVTDLRNMDAHVFFLPARCQAMVPTYHKLVGYYDQEHVHLESQTSASSFVSVFTQVVKESFVTALGIS
ncbi:hypothetical protein WA158_005327 [Blastocystis sp. Blastoise]